MSEVGVVDRTGALLPMVQRATARLADVELVDVGAPSGLGATTPRLDVLILGPRETGTAAALRRASKYASAHPASVVVGVVDNGTAAEHLLAHGVDRVVRGPLTNARVAGALRRAFADLNLLAHDAADLVDLEEEDEDAVAEVELEVEPEPEAELDPMASIPEQGQPADEEPEPPAPPKRAYVVTIASATGGCGKTFFACNAAYQYAQAGHRVLLVDTDLQFGEVAAALRVRHPYSVFDGLYDGQGRRLPPDVLEDHLDEIVSHHELGFDVLTAPRDPALADYVGARDAEHILDVVIPRYDVVIVDTPPSLNEVVLTTLDRSDIVTVLATLDVPSLKNLSVFLSTLQRLRIDDSRMRLVLNKCDGDVGITTAQAQEAFQGRFIGSVPHSRAVPRSINAGTVLLVTDPGSDVSGRLVDAVIATSPAGLLPPRPSRRSTRPSVWLRLRGMFRRSPNTVGGTP